MVEDRGVVGGEFLKTSHAAKLLNCPFSSSEWKVRVFRPIVQPTTGFLAIGRAYLSQCSAIRTESVGYDDVRPCTAIH